MTFADVKNIFVAGASRGVGFEVVKGLVQQGYQVVALIRTDDTRSQLVALGAQVIMGDALNPEAMQAAVQGFGEAPFSASDDRWRQGLYP